MVLDQAISFIVFCCRTLGIIKPDAMQKVGQIIDAIFQSGFRVTKLKMCRLTRSEAGNFYQEHQGKTFFE